MKIAIISYYCFDSSIPLAKHLSLKGIEVDLYCLLPQGDQNGFVIHFSSNKQPNGFVDSKIAKSAMGEKLCNYLSCINTKIFIYPDRWFQKIFFQDFYYAYLLANYIKKSEYDLVHIIHTSKRFWIFFYFFMDKRKIIQTLHEVTSHEAKTPFFDKWILKLLIKYSTPIIFHSNISKSRFVEFRKSLRPKKIKEDNLTMIRFGLYETYQLYAGQSIKINNDKIKILNFGRIVPYKGIHLLIEAVKLLQDQYPIHLVVAGSGYSYFDFNGINSYKFINKIISNEEIVNLIQECDLVVLPYISASQSGIPMTVYLFNKPIVASNIDGLREVIDHMETGILVDNINAESLVSSIKILLENSDLRHYISKNIGKKYSEGEFSWPSIAEKTLSFYKRQLSKT